jgi:hypothetical protein
MRSDLVRLCFQDEKEVSPLNRFVPCCSHVWTNREDGEPLNKRGKKKVQHLDRIVASCLAPHTVQSITAADMHYYISVPSNVFAKRRRIQFRIFIGCQQ